MLSAALSSIIHLCGHKQREPVACVSCVSVCEVITLHFTQVAMARSVSHSALTGMCQSFPFGKFIASVLWCCIRFSNGTIPWYLQKVAVYGT